VLAGPRGAHDPKHVRNPDWNEFSAWQDAAEGLIRVVTVAPETEGALAFIEKVSAAGVVVIWPDATFYFSKKLGIGRGADLVVYVAIVLLFFAVFRLVVAVEKQRREITRLTRLFSLKDMEDKK